MSAPGDLVRWQRSIRRGERTTRQEGYGVVREVGRGYVSIWPLSGPVDRALKVTAEDSTVLIPAAAVIAELDKVAGPLVGRVGG